MTEMCKAFAAAFVDRLVTGTVPFRCRIGEAWLQDAFGASMLAENAAVRLAEMDGIQAKLTYRLLDGGVDFGVRLENVGSATSPQIRDIDFCDLFVPLPEELGWGWGNRRVLYAVGSPTTVYDFQPREEDLARPDHLVLENKESRSSSDYLPYFNYSALDREGVVAAIGWSGHWRASFYPERNGTRIRFTYGADFSLEPGEAVELPRTLLMPWKREDDGDRDLTDVFVLWRRFMRRQILPKQNGQPIDGQVCLRAWGSVDEAGHNRRFANMKKFGLPCDAYGVDAGWYDLDGKHEGKDWFVTVGDWRESDVVYPHGLSWLAEGGRDAGAGGFWLWHEFERAVTGAGAYKAHPAFYLGNGGGPNHLIHFGDPAAEDYIRSLLYPIIRKTNMTVFRMDFNIDPSGIFRQNDAPDKQGLTELRYYNGLYGFFERMLADFPGLILDNCASGGRRLDWRMCALSIPVMCRSDYFTILRFDPNGVQAQTMGLSRWLPNHGDSCGSCMGTTRVVMDDYLVRSSYGSSFGLAAPDWELSQEEGTWYRKTLEEALLVKTFMSLDFYPLTGYGYSPLDWCAFEACDYDGSRALVMAFRREKNRSPEQTYALRGLQPDARYTLRDVDEGLRGTYTGAELSEGLTVRIDQPRGSRILVLEMVR